MSKYENEHCEIAARMLVSDPGLLDADLIDYLNLIAIRCFAAEGRLISRQAISVAVANWEMANPNKKSSYKA